MKIIPSFFIILFTLNAQAQTPALTFGPALPFSPILSGEPGRYEIYDGSSVDLELIEWSKFNQAQDQADYEKAMKESDQAFKEFYGSCAGDSYTTCTGFMKLKQISIESANNKKLIIPSEELNAVLRDYQKASDLFRQKLAQIEITRDLWAAQQLVETKSDADREMQIIFRRGSVNLGKISEIFRKGATDLESQAKGFTYIVNTGSGAVTTQAGKGLDIVNAAETEEFLAQKLEILQDALKVTPKQQQELDVLQINLGNTFASYLENFNERFVWYNSLQEKDKQDWIASLETKGRVLKYARALYCRQLGVPAYDIADEGKFMISYLRRGVPSKKFRSAAAREVNEVAIRSTLKKMDQIVVSIASQAGENNDVSGWLKWVHRANSVFTWQNEVSAFMSIIYIIRDQYVDELDLLADSVVGCERVRERYYARYVSMKDQAFRDIYKGYTEPLVLPEDALLKAYATAGKTINAKGVAMGNAREFLKAHPSMSLVEEAERLFDDEIR